MDLKDRASVLTETAKHRLAERHTDQLERENDRLKLENAALRGQTDREQEKIDKILDSLESSTSGPKKHRIRRLMTLSVAAGGAYVMGAKAGRERYEQLKRWWAERRNGGMDRVNEWGEDVTARASDAVQGASQRAAEKVVETGDAVARKVDQATTKAAGTVEQAGTKASKAVQDSGTQRIG
jgi:ferritin-like metal-binding protein YciE